MGLGPASMQSCFQPVGPQYVLMCGIIPLQGQNFTLSFAEAPI